MFCNYISLHFNLILSSLKLLCYFFSSLCNLQTLSQKELRKVFPSYEEKPCCFSYFIVLVCGFTLQVAVLGKTIWSNKLIVQAY